MTPVEEPVERIRRSKGSLEQVKEQNWVEQWTKTLR